MRGATCSPQPRSVPLARGGPLPGRGAGRARATSSARQPSSRRARRRVEHAAQEVARPRRRVLRLGAGAGRLAAHGVEQVDGRLDAGPDVEDAAAVAAHGGDERARRRRRRRRSRASARRRRRSSRGSPSREPVDEDRDDAALELRELPRAVDVGEAERDVPRPVQPVPRRQVLLAGELGRAVRRQRLARDRPRAPGARTRRRSRRPSSVKTTWAPAARAASSTRSVPRTFTCGVEVGTLDGGADVGLRGEMEAPPRAAPRRTTSSSGSRMSRSWSVAASGTFSRLPVARLSMTVHLVAAREQRLDEMRADEPRAPGDDRPHAPLS